MNTRYAVARHIQHLDPYTDAQRIMYLLSAYEHPWLMRKSLEFALFRTYAVPSISRLLKATRQFQQHGQKRYDDTSLLISTLTEQGYDSEYGQRAIARMNYWHANYHIKNDDFLYVLSVFVYEPIRWINRFGWRPMTEQEQQASYFFWREVGTRMHITDIPSSHTAFEQFNITYEREHFVYASANNTIGEATIQIFLHWYPTWLRPVVRQGIYALLDEPLRQAFGFPQVSGFLRVALPALLNIAKQGQRLLPPRRSPYHFTQAPNRTYPNGYSLDTLGPDQPVEITHEGAEGDTGGVQPPRKIVS